MRIASKCLLFLVGTLAVAFVSCEALEYRHNLRYVPEAMAVSRIEYDFHRVWSYWPKGKESGILVYAMPKQVRRALETDGVAWLDALPHNSWRTAHGVYSTWHATPVLPIYPWSDPAACPLSGTDRYRLAYPNGCPSIVGVMVAYGDLDFDPQYETMANKALSSPGSFYAIGRWGVLVLIPARDRIIYVY